MSRWKKLYCLDGKFTCPYCLNEFSAEDATRDHRQPRSRGGRSVPENITVCCKYCNSEKGALTPEEYELWKMLEFIRNGGLSQKNK